MRHVHLDAVVDDAADVPQRPAIEIDTAVTRRNWMKGAAAAAVGGTAVALGQASPVAAAEPMAMGSGAITDHGASQFIHSAADGSGMSFVFANQSALTVDSTPYPSVPGGWAGATGRPNGIFGHTSVRSGSASGVVGINNSNSGPGVRGEGRIGVSAQGSEYGVVADGSYGGVFIAPTDTTAPRNERLIRNANRLVSVADGRNLVTGAVNWSSDDQIIANGGIVGLSSQRQLKVFCGGRGSTHFIVEITGYYL